MRAQAGAAAPELEHFHSKAAGGGWLWLGWAGVLTGKETCEWARGPAPQPPASVTVSPLSLSHQRPPGPAAGSQVRGEEEGNDVFMQG